MNKLYLYLACLLCLSACVTTQPTASRATIADEGEEPIGQELTLRKPAPYYAQPDSMTMPAAVLPMSASTLYIVGRKGRWYRSQYPGHPSYYVLAYYFYPPGDAARRNVRPVVPTGRSSNTYNTQVGPRGGVYYINKNGNKTYIKRK